MFHTIVLSLTIEWKQRMFKSEQEFVLNRETRVYMHIDKKQVVEEGQEKEVVLT